MFMTTTIQVRVQAFAFAGAAGAFAGARVEVGAGATAGGAAIAPSPLDPRGGAIASAGGSASSLGLPSLPPASLSGPPPSPGASGASGTSGTSGASGSGAPIQGAAFSSITDPIETTGDGLRFHNEQPGEFVKLRSASGDLELQTRHERSPVGNVPNLTFNTAVGMKLGQDRVTVDAADNPMDLAAINQGVRVTINGQKRLIKPNEAVDLPGGGKIAYNGKITLTSPKGDEVTLQPGGMMGGPTGGFAYYNVEGKLSPSRKDGEVRGSLGSFDADTDPTNDLLGRNGRKVRDMAAFLDAWRVRPEESLLARRA